MDKKLNRTLSESLYQWFYSEVEVFVVEKCTVYAKIKNKETFERMIGLEYR